MRTMKKRTAIAVTAAVWLASLGSAAALTYELNRPLRDGRAPSPIAASSMSATASAAEARAFAAESFSEPPVIDVPTITIVASVERHRRSSPAASRAIPVKDISEMHCADWRSLDMGSGHVQICE
jgi:hypothetical protein